MYMYTLYMYSIYKVIKYIYSLIFFVYYLIFLEYIYHNTYILLPLEA